MTQPIEEAWQKFVARSLAGEDEITLAALRKVFFAGAVAGYEITIGWRDGVPLDRFMELLQEIQAFQEEVFNDKPLVQ